MEMKFRIYRFDPDADKEPYYQKYQISANPSDRILDCLNRIKWEQDGTLSYRMSCGHGVCGSDAMKINGRCALACQKLVKEYEGQEVVLEPLPSYKVLKDLVVDLEPFFEKVKLVRPYLISETIPPEKERSQSPENSKQLDTAIRCILCACCMGACPVVNENERFIGPAPLVWAFRYIFDSRDDKYRDRLRQLDYPDGAWACVNHYECTRVCPKEIPVTKYINTIKQEIQKTKDKSSPA
ncbi:MAG: succinate dehydrogenase iron-sulfur subunit [Candidatus Brocadia sp. AMX2]|uniref:succinate dehydrogenase n=2 Tax=Candidatus Brocadiaceae TaxID=1127830 RepID=A0ABQ0JWI0_9BACT|nr:MAG: succinate dehydrogenase iron-sulfur subunit [Candidatus Brocadia sp. AMX2]MBC6931117.1 succinate dehydrogenase iron-sulfur subunit [Candidatus Brocadia sp.]MBL1167484.1 succinate dehydrogenase iron-sulfur subunit [Candidatus Brocadia sp. AMX1]NOG41044.1 succinate dehydrogenase iron-sulfur subunit [Planctomycetota bacterium]GAN33139.1 succinate dehydrogenase and fumarate reductase iron-sulfur protein [Candidatus Brocadia sinica JPN1]GIK12987.1 MAG: succinate dehydrogenase iron-sulfur su